MFFIVSAHTRQAWLSPLAGLAGQNNIKAWHCAWPCLALSLSLACLNWPTYAWLLALPLDLPDCCLWKDWVTERLHANVAIACCLDLRAAISFWTLSSTKMIIIANNNNN